MKRIFVLLIAGLSMAACQSTPKHDESPMADGSPSEPDRSPSADTDTDYISEGGFAARIEKCGGRDGMARLERNGRGDLLIRFSNLECRYYRSSIDGEVHKFNDSDPVFEVNESVAGWHTLTIGSKSYFRDPKPGSKADVVRFYVPSKVVNLDIKWGQDSDPIPYCGGTVSAKVEDGQVRLDFRNVSSCDEVQMSKRGEETRHYNMDFRGSGYGKNLTVPKSWVNAGSNEMDLYLYKKYSKEVRIHVVFRGSWF